MKRNPEFDKEFTAKVESCYELVENYWMPKWRRKNGIGVIYCTPAEYAEAFLSLGCLIAESFAPVVLQRDRK